MPARGRRKPKNILPADKYFQCVHVYNADQERLKTQQIKIVENTDTQGRLVNRFKDEINDRLLISMEVFSNPDIYRWHRDALESIKVSIPSIVQDITSSSSISKRIIAAIWNELSDTVTRDSLLLEYQNIRKIVINANKDILTRIHAA